MERSINFLIEHQCPQCGGPIVLEETDRLFTCDFCQVKSYLVEKGHFRYLLPHNAPEGETLFFMPYWRFKGMIFSVSPAGIKERFVDHSHQAVSLRHLPVSLGLRSQALKLKFVTPDREGIFLDPVQNAQEIMETMDYRFQKDLPKPILHMDHIGESLSLIFSPFYKKGDKIFDAILNKPVSGQLTETFSLDSLKSSPPGAYLKFLPTLCPDCGWDLRGQRDSLTLHCRNCEAVWHPRNGRLVKTNTAHFTTQNGEVLYLPFWRIRCSIKGLPLSSYADFIRVANLPKVIQSPWEETPFRFWGPAFKVRPQRYLKLATGITVSQPTEQLTRGMPKTDQLVSVNLPLREALETLKLNLANFIRPKQLMLDVIQDIEIKPKSYVLVYIPFNIGPHEFIQPDLNLAINKNQLQLAGNL